MKFSPTGIAGAYRLDIEPHHDDRGFFARAFCRDELKAHGLELDIVQCNVTSNPRKGTLRGMHYQQAPHEEAKIVRSSRGAMWDVMLDLRADSKTFRQWRAETLTAEHYRMVYVPRGIAHGYLTLADDTEVFYLMAQPYVAEAARGIRWDDPAFGIEWPFPPVSISARDRAFAPWQAER